LSHVAIVAGDFVKTGGMDRANYALADYLARSGARVTLVGHRAAPEVVAEGRVEFRRVPKPMNSYTLGEPFLDYLGRRAAREAVGAGGSAVVNGGNCIAGPVNWMHYVHSVYPPAFDPRPRRARTWLHGVEARRRERRSLGMARLVLANSAATRRAIIEGLGVPPERARVVYYGIDATQFLPVSEERARETRKALGWPNRPTAAFIGALGDRRKGFDTLFGAWQTLCRTASWDVDLVAVGAGSDLSTWRERAASAGLGERVRLLGFRNDVPHVLAACDALVAPTRYEAFGLGVAEALACGLPAIVSADAGVAELYPDDLSDFLLADPESESELVHALTRWRSRLDDHRRRIVPLTERVRARSWDDMAAEVVRLITEHAS
jgi:glycosyltransferase involved in cell wall biosynthesis